MSVNSGSGWSGYGQVVGICETVVNISILRKAGISELADSVGL
jgi:hypothetical protein